MIGDIRNAWVRRPLVVAVSFAAVVLCILMIISEAVIDRFEDEFGDVMRSAWRGPRHRG